MSDTPASPSTLPATTPVAGKVETVRTFNNDSTDDKTVQTTSSTTIQPGYKTSEFWQSMIVTAAGATAFVWGIVKGDNSAMMAGLGVMGISSGAYSLSRGVAKRPS